jgi:NADH-quinone oxidoreductase subunit K
MPEQFEACERPATKDQRLTDTETMADITTLHYLVVAAALFVLGVIGVLTRRNVVIVLMSIELILNSVNLNLVAFSRMWGNLHGQLFAIFVVVDAAAEAAVGLGILIAFFRNKETINVDEIDLLKW